MSRKTLHNHSGLRGPVCNVIRYIAVVLAERMESAAPGRAWSRRRSAGPLPFALVCALGKSSPAFSFVFRAADRTLTDDEVNAAFAKIQQDITADGQIMVRG